MRNEEDISRNRSQKLTPIATEGDFMLPYLKCKLITSCAHVTHRTGQERTSDWQTLVSHILQQYVVEQYETEKERRRKDQ